jgi:kumamolisin
MNPALYRIGAGSRYAADFHDIADGSTNGRYPAVAGYDDATGWGSLNGQALLTDLSGTAPLNSSPVAGDMNGDGKVTVADATIALQIAVGLVTPTSDQLLAGDFNHSGKIDLTSAVRILQIAVGSPSEATAGSFSTSFLRSGVS